jgi:hypothetical protein
MTTSTMVDLVVMGLATLTGILFGIGVGTVFERRRARGVAVGRHQTVCSQTPMPPEKQG